MKSYEKLLLAGLGLISVSTKETKRLLKIISKKKISEKEITKTITSLVKEGKTRESELVKKIKVLIKKTLKELDVPTRDELNTLKKKIDTLSK